MRKTHSTTVPSHWLKVRPGMDMGFWYRVGREATRLGIRKDMEKVKELIWKMR